MLRPGGRLQGCVCPAPHLLARANVRRLPTSPPEAPRDFSPILLLLLDRNYSLDRRLALSATLATGQITVPPSPPARVPPPVLHPPLSFLPSRTHKIFVDATTLASTPALPCGCLYRAKRIGDASRQRSEACFSPQSRRCCPRVTIDPFAELSKDSWAHLRQRQCR